MSERFHVDGDLSPGPFEITGPEAHHLATVCRLRPGDPLVLFNGRGEECPARISQVAKKSVLVEVLAVERPDREVGFRLEVAAPLPKGDRADFLIEKLTELGVTCFTPLQTARSVVHPRESKLDRLQRHVIEASKQCGRNVLMRIAELTRWSDFCKALDCRCGRFWLIQVAKTCLVSCRGRATGMWCWRLARKAALPMRRWNKDKRLAGWWCCSGPRILRVETAAVVLATMLGMGRLSRGPVRA